VADEQRYGMPDAEHEDRFQRIIKPRYLEQGRPAANPVAYLVGGQPGAGKSSVEEKLKDRHRDEGLVWITGDNYRQHHPRYREMFGDNDMSMPNRTQAASGGWVKKSIDHVRDTPRAGKRNVAIEGTFRDPETTRKTALELEKSGYEVRMVFVATPASESRLRALQRYQDGKIASDRGRHTPVTAHEAGYTGTAQTASAVDRQPYVSSVEMYDRYGNEIYHNRRGTDGRWEQPAAAREKLDAERHRAWTPQEERSFGSRLQKLRDPDVPANRSKARWQDPAWRRSVDDVAEIRRRERAETAQPELGQADRQPERAPPPGQKDATEDLEAHRRHRRSRVADSMKSDPGESKREVKERPATERREGETR